MIGVEACAFRHNGIAFSYNTRSYSYFKSGFPDCTIEDNDIGVQILNIPGASPLDFCNTVFSGNRVDIENPISYPLDLSNAIFE